MDVMTSPAECCSPDDSLERVAELMWDYEIRALPVVDAAGRPIGWLTDRAICMTALRSQRALKPLRVRQAMMPSPPVVRRDFPLCLLERELSQHGSDWLVVIDDDGTVAGIVTTGDVDRALRALGRRTMGAPRPGIVFATKQGQ